MIDFEKIGKYEITARLGQGSFGVVYKGRDPFLKRDVAIKVCSVDDEGLRQRFFREAEISGRLVHKNIVTVYEFGFEGEIPYLVQEMLTGQDLSRLIKRRAPTAPALKLDYLLQAAGGLGYAHGEGVIHRDVKPSNLRVLEDGQVKIMDFGIAKLASAETQLTQKGVTMGTASYLPPEQVRGSDLDHRADVFSFGVLAFELLTYERPFSGNTLSALIYQILYKVPQPMSEVWAECPEAVSSLVAKCLEKKPERRFGSFAEVIGELATVRDQVLSGRWPALRAGASAAGGPAAEAPEADEPGAVLSQSAIAETARGVLEGRVSDETTPTAVSAPEAGRPPDPVSDGRATRPIPKLPAATPAVMAADENAGVAPADEDAGVAPADEVDEGLETRALPTIPEPPAPSRAGESTGERLDLAQEIGGLVAQGKLEAAKEQLEATLHHTGLADAAANGASTAWETRVLPNLPAAADETPSAAAALQPPSPTPAGPSTVASDTYGTLRLPLLRPGLIGLAAAGVLAAGLGWLLLRGGGKEALAPVEPRPAPPAATAAGAAGPDPGAVAIHAAPWAEVTEITDASGYLRPLPESPITPLYLELAPGVYTIRLRLATGEELITCDVEVTPGAIASCAPAPSEASVTEYFRESGWWR